MKGDLLIGRMHMHLLMGKQQQSLLMKMNKKTVASSEASSYL
jgi:hypothetical protein